MPTKPPVFRRGGQRSPVEREAARPSRIERGYTQSWVRASKLFLLEHPACACAECQARGIPLRATVVDHIVPHRGDPDLFWNPENWQPLAKRCHDRKTWREVRERSGVIVHRLRPQKR